MFLQHLCTHEIWSIISAVYIHLFALIGNNMLSSAQIAFTHMVNADRQRAQPLPSPSLSLSPCPICHVQPIRIIALPLNLPLAATIKIKMSGLLKFKRFTLRGQKAFLFFPVFPFASFGPNMKIEDNDGQHRTQYSTRTWTEGCRMGQLYVNEGRDWQGGPRSRGEQWEGCRCWLCLLWCIFHIPQRRTLQREAGQGHWWVHSLCACWTEGNGRGAWREWLAYQLLCSYFGQL